MRHATWLALESLPGWRDLYTLYRRIPDPVRAPLRWIVSPRWYVAAALIRGASGDTVVAGPFRGMKLGLSPLSSRHLLGYILGTQELELRAVTEELVSRGYAKILNVGAA